MAGIMSLLQKLGFTSGAEDEMNTGARYEQDEDEEDEDEEEDEEEGGRGFGFPFSLFGRRNQEEEDEEEAEEDEDAEGEEEEEQPPRTAQPRGQGRPQGNPARVIDYKKGKEKRREATGEERRGKHCEHIVIVRQLADSRTIITHLHNGDSVILNLENIDPKDCGRVIDLLSGAAFALGGNIIKVSRLTYLLAPDTVRVVPPQSAPTANRYTM